MKNKSKISGRINSRKSKKKVDEGAIILAVDETSLSETPVRVCTWSRKGKTPIITHNFNWKRLSLLIFASPAGHLLYDILPGSITSGRIILNLMALLKTFQNKIVILWDGASIHRAKIVQQFLEKQEVKERLEVVRLPPYSPDLNPVELVNAAIKKKGLGNYAAENLEQLGSRAKQALCQFRQQPEKLRNCFEKVLGCRFDACKV